MVILLNIKNTIIDFLYDKKYFITMYENYIYIYNFNEILTLTNTIIIITIDNFKVKLIGNDLKIIKLNKSELLIEGNIISIGKIYE